MLSLSQEVPQNLKWQLEEEMITELYYKDSFASYNTGDQAADTSYQSRTCSPSQFYIDGGTTTSTNHPISNNSRKSSHNAYERDRRKKLNHIYSSLRSLLPTDDHRNNKLSIPSTISRVLKYIPELQRQVERLKRRKDEIVTTKQLSREGETSRQQRHPQNAASSLVYPIVSVARLNKTELMMQMCFFKKARGLLFSKVIKILEQEGLFLVNASTFKNNHADKTFYNIHLQETKDLNMEDHMIRDHLIHILNEQASSRLTKCFLA